MQSILFKLQEAVAIRLRRRRDFSRIPVLTRKNGELSARVKEAIALGGLCVVIMPPRPHKVDAAQNTPVITELELCVRVVESAFQNHGTDALTVAELVSRALHGWQPAAAGITSPLALDSDSAWAMDEEPDKKGRYTIEVNFTSAASL
ncbi:MAG: hypothetical protein JW942_08340 [Opitutales bacterium]|nr:hypothetical protein [Opitutales bacterium]